MQDSTLLWQNMNTQTQRAGSLESDLYKPYVREYTLAYIYFRFSIYWLKHKLTLYPAYCSMSLQCLIFAVVTDCHLKVTLIQCKLLESSVLTQRRYFTMFLESIRHHFRGVELIVSKMFLLSRIMCVLHHLNAGEKEGA